MGFGKAVFYGILGAIGIVVVGSAISIVTAPMRMSSGIVNRTMNANHALTSYEWFHDANGTYISRVSQIRANKEFYKTETDPAEKQRLHIELGAQQQSCRDIVTQYNANSMKTNVDIFKGTDAPVNLDISLCE